MLAALQQQHQPPAPAAQPSPSPVFTIGLSSQDFPPPSFKRTRSISQLDDGVAVHKRTTSFAQSLIAAASSSPPPPPPHPVSAQPHSASASGSSLFGDDPIFAGLLENATFASPARQAENGAVTAGTAQAASFNADGFLPVLPLQASPHRRPAAADWSLTVCSSSVLCCSARSVILRWTGVCIRVCASPARSRWTGAAAQLSLSSSRLRPCRHS